MIRDTIPGKVMEVDFGYLGKVWDPANKRARKAWVFSGRLRHSRRAWREVVYDQRQETFFSCHERAFEYFGGVPEEVVPDNLKAAVVANAWENPLYNRAYRSLARHYGFRIDPCLPARPEHKGGVERGILYIKRNFWPIYRVSQRERGHQLPWVDEIQSSLEKWSAEEADTRKLYGFMRTPLQLFEEERGLLKSLPNDSWEQEVWEKSTIRRDWRIRYDYSWYSVPYGLIEQDVQICGTDKCVRVFHNGKAVAVHNRSTQRGSYIRNPEHAPPDKENYMSQTRAGLLQEAEVVGPSTAGVVKEIFNVREVDGMRPVRRLLGLKRHYSAEDLESACRRALEFHTPEYGSVKNILKEGLHVSTERPGTKHSLVSTSPPNTSATHLGRFRFARPAEFFMSKAISFFTLFQGA
jgi:hypothetical protein